MKRILRGVLLAVGFTAVAAATPLGSSAAFSDALVVQEASAMPLVTSPNADATAKDLVWYPRADDLLRIADASWAP